MSIINKIKNFFSTSVYKQLYGVELEDVIKEGDAYSKKQERLKLLLKNEMQKPSIKMEEMLMTVDTWEEYTIEHIYADMQVLKKAFVKMRTLPNVKDIVFDSDFSIYDFSFERGSASIIVDCYKIKLTAWNLGEEESLEILNFCVDEIVKVQDNINNLKTI